MARKRIGEVLLERGIISREDLDRALQLQQQSKAGQAKMVRLGEILVEGFTVRKSDIAAAIEEIKDIPYTECRDVLVEPAARARIPFALALRCCALPLRIEDRRLVVVMAEPRHLSFLDELNFCSGLRISPRFAFREDIIHAILKAYGSEVCEFPEANLKYDNPA